MQAFEIYEFWKNNSNLSAEENQERLKEALKHCGHGCAAENLGHSLGSRSNTVRGGGKPVT